MRNEVSILIAVFILLLPFTGFTQSLPRADSLFKEGMDYYNSGQYRQAEANLSQAYTLYKAKSGPERWLRPGIEYAEVLVDRSKYQEGIALFNELNKAAIDIGDVTARTIIENDLGWVYEKIDEQDKALTHLKKALPLSKQVGDSVRLGYINNNIGAIYLARGDYQKSLDYRQKSLAILEKLEDEKSSVSIALNNIASTYRRLSLYDKAIEYYERSRQIREEVGNIGLIASIYNNIGLLKKKLGLYDEALISMQKSLKYSRKAGSPENTAISLNNIGSLYRILGQNERALEYFQQSLEIKKAFAGPSTLAIAYKNIGHLLWELGQNKQAIEYLEKALSLRRASGNAKGIATHLIDFASIKRRQGNFTAASDLIEEAQVIADSTNNSALQFDAAYELGRLNFSTDEIKSAISYYKQALAYSKNLSSRSSLAPLKSLAFAYNYLNSDSSIYYGKQAIKIIEERMTETGSLAAFQAGYFQPHADFYSLMASWQLKYFGDIDQAYELIESAKARVLSGELAQAAQRIDESLPDSIRIERAQQRAQITSLYDQLDGETNQEKKEEVREKLRNKEFSYAAFENKLQQEFDQFKQIKAPEPVDLAEVKKMIEPGTVVLEYAVTNDQLLIFLISRNETFAKRISLGDTSSEKPLANYILEFRQAIAEKKNEQMIKKQGQLLYDKLIAPFEKPLANYKNLIIVPSEYMAYLPFEALYSDNYLVSQYNIKYAPSMTGFSLIPEPENNFGQTLLAIGNSANYQAADAAVLPAAGLEVQQISKLVDQPKLLQDQQITEERVQSMLQQSFRYIHVAAHSFIDEQNSLMSGIMVGKANPDRLGMDGYLRSSEIYRLNIDSEMVVLSACESGMGQLIGGEGLLGLQRSFFNAGVSTVVVSLWDVYDRATTYFMKKFYQLLFEKQENKSWSDTWDSWLRWAGWSSSIPYGYKAPSIREAKLAMLQHPEYHHPVYWAPFVVVGR